MSSSSDLAHQIAEALKQATAALQGAPDVESLRRVANEHSGKGSVLVGLKATPGSIVDVEARKTAGRKFNSSRGRTIAIDGRCVWPR